jgi:aldehyde dehydrogenase (NAD+)
VELANNTPYGLAASVWTENVSLALDVAAKVKAGTVWVNCTNRFDASSGFGGFRESGFGREGGREGLWEYLREIGDPRATRAPAKPVAVAREPGPENPALDRTHKQYVGGKQARPDSGYSLTLATREGPVEVARGNRKDVRNAVEAARAAQPGWQAATAHLRSQILYYLAENLEASGDALGKAVAALSPDVDPELEVADAIRWVFALAAKADKFEGAVHAVPLRALTYTRPEPMGVVAVVLPDERPLVGLVALAGAAVAMGNAVVALPSEANPLPAVELYRILDASDVPGGVFNILTGLHHEMDPVLAEHDGVEAMWHFGSAEGGARTELLSAGNLKRTWVSGGAVPAWLHEPGSHLDLLFRQATQVKNVWVPYGE